MRSRSVSRYRDDEETHGLGGPNEVANQQQSRLLGPLEVVEHEHDPGRRRQGAEPGTHRVKEPVSLGLGIRLQRRIEAGNGQGQVGDEADEFSGVAPPGRSTRAARHELLEGLDEGLVPHTDVLVAAAEEDHPTLVVGVAGHLGGKSGFADARLARYQDDATFAAGGQLPSLEESLHLGGASREGQDGLGGKPGRERGPAGEKLGRFPAHNHDRQGLG